MLGFDTFHFDDMPMAEGSMSIQRRRLKNISERD